MGEKELSYPLFHFSHMADVERPFEKAMLLMHFLEQAGFKESAKRVAFSSGRKVFSMSMEWRKKYGMSEKRADVSIEGWELDGKGRVSVVATGKEIMRISYRGFFESLVADIAAESFRPGKAVKREDVEKAVKKALGK